MYCIRKYADCWAIHNLENELSRTLTQDEVEKIREVIPALNLADVASYFTDDVDCLEDKP